MFSAPTALWSDNVAPAPIPFMPQSEPIPAAIPDLEVSGGDRKLRGTGWGAIQRGPCANASVYEQSLEACLILSRPDDGRIIASNDIEQLHADGRERNGRIGAAEDPSGLRVGRCNAIIACEDHNRGRAEDGCAPEVNE
jgi:hypothetical protein